MAGGLFPDPVRPRDRALGFAEPAVRWLRDLRSPEARAARAQVNAAYARFPDCEGRLARTLHSEKDREHYQALDELFVHELLYSTGLEVRYEEHPGPDFRTYRKGQLILPVEVASIFEKRAWEEEWRNFAQLADAINPRARVSGYMVGLNPLLFDRVPSVARLRQAMEQWLESLPPSPAQGGPSPGAHFYTTYRDEGVEIELTAIPMRKNAPALDDPDAALVVQGPVIGGMVDSARRMKAVLRNKRAARYHLDSVPYVVAIGNHDHFCSDTQVMTALYGPDRISLEPGDPRNGSLSLDYLGYFGVDYKTGEARHPDVSTVAVFKFPASAWHEGEVLLLDNPYAVEHLPAGLFPHSRRFHAGPDGWDWDPPLAESTNPLPFGGEG